LWDRALRQGRGAALRLALPRVLLLRGMLRRWSGASFPGSAPV